MTWLLIIVRIPNIKSEEKMNSELRNKWKESISGHESDSREQQNGKSRATKATNIVVNANPVLAGRSTEQHDGESRTESKEKSAACGVRTIITPGPESNPNEQHMLNSEPDLS
jgi:WRKY transcription factor 1